MKNPLVTILWLTALLLSAAITIFGILLSLSFPLIPRLLFTFICGLASARFFMFAGCIMVITEPKPWGAQGYVQALGENGSPGGQAFYRAKWEEMEYVGMAAWVIDG